ncbi:MAG: adenylyltransferase/cytidyltransferase family protein [Candidatus Diapherotrites archaeon]|nr:adenylyltransferase/cytidyltransferase family protein [Candidatus Diapherotrites archaeon]
MTTAIFVGRFQPLHKGHIHAIKQALKDYDEVIIGIGSSQESGTLRNPYSYEERVRMIKEKFPRIKVIPIPDVNDDEKWVKQILDKVHVDVAITGNDWTRRCFEKAGIKVVDTYWYHPHKYRGTIIRRKKIWKKE